MTLVGSWAGPRGRFMRFLVRVATDFDAFASSETLARFWVPPALTLAVLPFFYLLGVYMAYQQAFVRLGFFMEDEPLLGYAKRAFVRRFRLNLGELREVGSGPLQVRVARAGRRSTQYSSARRRSVLPRYAQVSSADLRPQKIPAQRLWPREESNLRTRIRSPLLYPLSYGARRRSVARGSARPWTAPGSCARPAGPAAARGFARPRS